MTDRKKWLDDPQVPIDAGRLRTAIAASKQSPSEISARVRCSRQRLHYLAYSTKGCRRKLRRALARVLRVSVQWLAGEPVSSPSFLNLALEAELGEPTHLDRVWRRRRGFSLEAALPARGELEAVDLVRVLSKLSAGKPVPPSRALVRYAYGLLPLELWRIYLDGATLDVAAPRDSEDFTVALAEAVRVLLRPWEEGQREISPVGVKSLRQIGDMVMATAAALQRSESTDLFSWQARLAVLS